MLSAFCTVHRQCILTYTGTRCINNVLFLHKLKKKLKLLHWASVYPNMALTMYLRLYCGPTNANYTLVMTAGNRTPV